MQDSQEGIGKTSGINNLLALEMREETMVH